MSPVADCSLTTFLSHAEHAQEHRDTLRTFFGCLAGAVAYLHQNKIRHRDIKPDNILVRGSQVYLTDFGISLDWESLSRSTTTEESGKTPNYCAPEVAEQHQKRNSSTDVWSLGCVYMEMLIVIRGFTVIELKRAFHQSSETRTFYKNTEVIYEWISQRLKELRPIVGQSISHLMQNMLSVASSERPAAHEVYHVISTFQFRDRKSKNPYCGRCCSEELEIADNRPDPIQKTYL